MEAKKAPVPNTVETGEEIPLRAGHKHSSRESFQWAFLLNKRRLSLSGESVSMQLFLKDNLEL